MKKILTVILSVSLLSSFSYARSKEDCKLFAEFLTTCLLYGNMTNLPCLKLKDYIDNPDLATLCITYCSAGREYNLTIKDIKELQDKNYSTCIKVK